MITEAAQSVAIVVGVGGLGGLAMWRLMFAQEVKPPRDLGEGFTGATGRRERWVSVLSPKEPARLREGTR